MTADQQAGKRAINRMRQAANECATELVSQVAQLGSSQPALAIRQAVNALTTELYAALREYDESDAEMTPVRPPSRTDMQAVRVGQVVTEIFDEAKGKR